MSKISDGYHRRSIENFISSLEEAKGYLGEVISYLYVAFDQEYLSRDVLNDTLNKGYTVGIHINSYLKTLKNY
jgi:four helix bundle protein